MNRMSLSSKYRILILASGIILAALILSCSRHDDTKTGADGDSLAVVIRPDQILRDARIYLYDKFVRTTDLEADSIEKYEAQDSSLAWNLKVRFFDSSGAQISYLEADSGLVRQKTNFMEVYGHVKVVTSDSAWLFTEKLAYDVRTDSINTEEFVKIIQAGDTIQGYGLSADQRLKNIRIKRQVKGTLQSTEQILD